MLISGNAVDTFTSLKENFGLKQLLNSKAIRIVDIPGHERLRLKFLDQYKYSGKALAFIIDSSTISKEIRDVAE